MPRKTCTNIQKKTPRRIVIDILNTPHEKRDYNIIADILRDYPQIMRKLPKFLQSDREFLLEMQSRRVAATALISKSARKRHRREMSLKTDSFGLNLA